MLINGKKESLFTGAYVLVLNTPWASVGHKFYKYKDKNLVHVNNIKNLASLKSQAKIQFSPTNQNHYLENPKIETQNETLKNKIKKQRQFYMFMFALALKQQN